MHWFWKADPHPDYVVKALGKVQKEERNNRNAPAIKRVDTYLTNSPPQKRSLREAMENITRFDNMYLRDRMRGTKASLADVCDISTGQQLLPLLVKPKMELYKELFDAMLDFSEERGVYVTFAMLSIVSLVRSEQRVGTHHLTILT